MERGDRLRERPGHSAYKQYLSVSEGYEDGQASFWADYWDRAALDNLPALIAKSPQKPAIDQHVPPEGLLLDAGCGLGGWMIYLKSPTLSVCGVDLNLKALKRLKQHSPLSAVSAADVVHLPYADSSFGCCLSLGVVEHLELHLEEAIREAHRVLAPDGLFLVSVPFMSPLKKLILPQQPSRAAGSTFFYQYEFTEEEISGILCHSGFHVIDVHFVGRTAGIQWRFRWLRRSVREPRDSGFSRVRRWMGILYHAILRILPTRVAAHMILLVCRKELRKQIEIAPQESPDAEEALRA